MINFSFELGNTIYINFILGTGFGATTTTSTSAGGLFGTTNNAGTGLFGSTPGILLIYL